MAVKKFPEPTRAVRTLECVQTGMRVVVHGDGNFTCRGCGYTIRESTLSPEAHASVCATLPLPK